MEKTNTNNYRQIETYSPAYLKQKAKIMEWRSKPKNRKKYLKYLSEYNKNYIKIPSVAASALKRSVLRYTIARYVNGQQMLPETVSRVRDITGMTLPRLVAHLGFENCKIWTSGLRVVELDHIVPLSRFKNRMEEGAFNYTNLRIIPASMNRSWKDATTGKTSQKEFESIVAGAAKQTLGLN